MEALGGLVTLVALYMNDPEQVSRESSVPSAVPQPVVAQLTRAAIFLVVTVNSGKENKATVRTLFGDLAALLRAVGFRDLEGRLSCVMAFGSDAWDRLFGAPKPKKLHPFSEIHGRHTLSQHRATSFTSNWRHRSCRGSAAPFPRRTKCTASTISMIAT
jgi:hypothetical protein